MAESRSLGDLTIDSRTTETLAHARRDANRKKFDEFLIVDVDAHVRETLFWDEVTDRIPSDVWRYNAKSFKERGGAAGLSNGQPGLNYQDMFLRVPHGAAVREKVDRAREGHPQVVATRRAMDAMGIDYMTVFPTPMLSLGVHPQPEVEVELAKAYNRWLCEEILPQDPGILGLLYLPFNTPEACAPMVEELGGKKGVAGFTVTSTRHKPVHHNSYMRLYATLEERGLPLAFHAGLQWEDGSMAQLNRFISMHALSFVHFNLIHMTNWIVNGLPERFPKLKPLWIESGLSWVPYLMQRLDSEYMMRTSEAPLLKRKPSEYMREMYYSSQPIELDHMKLVESTFEAINAETQLLYASDWPHWDFDTPSTIYDLPFLNERQKRNILGGNAARLFGLKDKYQAKAAAEWEGAIVTDKLSSDLPQQITHTTDTRHTLAHAKKYVQKKRFDEFMVVDVDAHVSEGMFWDEVTDRIDSDVWKYNAKSFKERGNAMGLSNAAPGILYQGVNGRIPHQERLGEAVTEKTPHKQVVLARRAMDAMGIDYMSVFPTPMLTMGEHPQPEVEALLGQAYNRWLTEKVLPEDSGLLGFLYLPFNDAASCPKMVEEFGDKKGVIGFSVTSTRQRPVHHNDYMRLYAMLEERNLPLVFHAGFSWTDGSMAQLNRFLSMHALSFVHCNLIHMTNWVINGLPERFPKLKTIWIESGLAWIPYLMQRLDSEYMMRTSEAPLLKRKPSEYMKEMYYSSQPIELHNMKLVEATLEAINAETQLLYASDWPHWDFDTPSTIYDLPFLNEKQKRNILGGNAARLFGLQDKYQAKAAAE